MTISKIMVVNTKTHEQRYQEKKLFFGEVFLKKKKREKKNGCPHTGLKLQKNKNFKNKQTSATFQFLELIHSKFQKTFYRSKVGTDSNKSTICGDLYI